MRETTGQVPRAHPRLGLGTVQFGLPYGAVADHGGRPASDVDDVLDRARELGISVLDTAAAYGESEARLGASGRLGGFRVVTKTAAVDAADAASAKAQVLAGAARSRQLLGVEVLDGLLVHDPRDLLTEAGKGVVEAGLELRADGLVRAFGASVYEAEQLDVVAGAFEPDIVQLPLNVLDQRLLRSGHVAALRAAGTEVHVRSVLLQGLLAAPASARPAALAAAAPHLDRVAAAAAGAGLSPLELALGFAAGLDVDVVLVGARTVAELDDCAAALVARPGLDVADLAVDDADVVDPRRWPT